MQNNCELQKEIEKLNVNSSEFSKGQMTQLFSKFLYALNTGEIRAAEKVNGKWHTNLCVKQGILLLFKYGTITEMSINRDFRFFDKNTIPLRHLEFTDEVRLVPGGSSIRTGSYIGKGVICMPPMFVNIGAYIGEGTMLDSNTLVGTCAQIGKRVHISAASQIGGVLEPIGANPVIIEDDVMIGGNCGIYEGVIIEHNAVLGSGVILTASSKIYDLVNDRIIKATDDTPLTIPAEAVVVQGSRALHTDFAKEHQLSISTPLIVKYRDDRTNKKTELEDVLREKWEI